MQDPATATTPRQKRAIYVADPMCSWCWGFAPVVAAIAELAAGRAEIRVVVGGLRVGPREPMRDRDKDYVRHHWQAVANETGQPFAWSFFEREGFVYDTEPACRAVVAVRSLAPDAALGFLAAVQRAFYAENRDVTDTAVLTEIAHGVGLDRGLLAALLAEPEIADATRADFRLVQAAGIPGFPAVILQDGDRSTLLTIGYRPYEALRPQVEDWLRDE